MNIVAKATITATIILELTEEEARAIHDLSAFNGESVVAAFGKEASPAWARDYGPGFVKLLSRVRNNMGSELDRITAARNAFRGIK